MKHSAEEKQKRTELLIVVIISMFAIAILQNI